MALASQSGSRDAERVARFLGGDPAGFEELVREHSAAVYNFIRRFLGDPEAARDVLQETLVAALESIRTFDPARPFRPWLLGIAANRCREERRRRQPVSFDDLGVEPANPAAPDPARTAEDRDTALRVAQAVAALDDAHRAVFLLRIYGDFTYRDIGDILNISEGTAKSRMHYAVYNVRKILKALEE